MLAKLDQQLLGADTMFNASCSSNRLIRVWDKYVLICMRCPVSGVLCVWWQSYCTDIIWACSCQL